MEFVKTRAIELYNELRKIDSSVLFVSGVKEKKLPKLIAHHARFIGSEFDRSLKSIIGKVNAKNHVHYASFKFCIDVNSEKYFTSQFNSYKSVRQKETTKQFNLHNYLDSYDFQSFFTYGIQNKNEIFQCQQYLNELHRNLDFKSISSQQLCLTGLQVGGCRKLLDNEGVSRERNFISVSPDLILDNRLIDIKADIKINGRKNKYAAQLLFYYFLIQLQIDVCQNSPLDEIKKIGIYYASYNKLIEVDVNQLIPNKIKLIELVKNEITYGNHYIRDIIEKSLLVKPLSDEQLFSLESKIKEKKNWLYETSYDEISELSEELSEIKLALELKKVEAEALKAKVRIIKTYAELFKKGLISKKMFLEMTSEK